MISDAKIGKPMMTARYATSSSTLWLGSQLNRSFLPWTRYATAAPKLVAKMPYEIIAIATWMVISGGVCSAGPHGPVGGGGGGGGPGRERATPDGGEAGGGGGERGGGEREP